MGQGKRRWRRTRDSQGKGHGVVRWYFSAVLIKQHTVRPENTWHMGLTKRLLRDVALRELDYAAFKTPHHSIPGLQIMKKNVPNLSAATGVSHDFRIAFGNLSNYLERIRDNDPPRTRHLAKRAFLHRAVPHYEEYFDPETYTNALTESNREVVASINAVIDTINELRSSEIIDYDRLHPLEQALLSLISGKPLDKD